jgi:DNA-binding NtrC family response regulator
MSLSPTPHGRRRLLGRYQIRGKLGAGNLGSVYRAWDEAEERVVALKVLRTEELIADALAGVQAEFRAVASLRHPQIARVYDFGFTDEGRVPFFTREYIEGKPLPPAWSDLFVAVGHLASGRESEALFQGVQRTFRELGIVFGARFAQLGLLLRALVENDDNLLRARAAEIMSPVTTEQRFLAVAEPVALAATFLRLGETERAGENLAAAASSIVGSPFLEVDWELEFLRASLAQRQGDLREARRHLHRCLHCRDLLTQSVPARWRERFLSHRRFGALNDAAARLNIQAVSGESTERLRQACGYQGLVGRSGSMEALFQTIERLREQDAAVLLVGETGSGKDLVARALHRSGIRRDRALKIIACACLPNELFESELFGHIAGAFTGAEHDQIGLLEDANGGTAVLEDVDQLSLDSQAKLLRVLESGTIRRVGGTSDIRIDVRFVATTSGDLRPLAEQGRFRSDLYYRLARVELRIPPLRERRDDIPLLTQHFLEKHAQRLDRGVARIEPAAVELLQAHDWPGNVRELESFLFRLLVTLPRSETIRREDIGPLLSRDRASLFDREPSLLERDLGAWQRDLERAYLTRLFVAVRGDLDMMMDRLGIKSTKLYGWLRDLDLDIRELRQQLRLPP